MGYRGKVVEQAKARQLRAKGLTMDEIAVKLGVSKSSVSLWARDVPFQPRLLKTKARRRGPNPLQRRKQEEIECLRVQGVAWVGRLTEKEFLVAGAALYAGEGAKTQAQVGFSNSDPRLVAFFCAWLRKFFAVDESRLRVRLYLHRGLDLDGATAFWSEVTAIPTPQFTAPYRADPDPSIRRAKHPLGYATVVYCCSRTHRAVMGVVDALLTSNAIPG
ncbi:MAG: hypothetical protein JOZ68_18950 [Acidimicrobiia bacterium]|nr:hypothetical protein [Acidimicrobiia bacterium]